MGLYHLCALSSGVREGLFFIFFFLYQILLTDPIHPSSRFRIGEWAWAWARGTQRSGYTNRPRGLTMDHNNDDGDK